MKNLSNAQLKLLRRESHSLSSIFQLGKNGLTETFIQQFDSALEKRELIKFSILQNSDEDLADSAQKIADQLGAHLVQTIGNTAILYRPSKTEKYQSLSKQVNQLE